MAEAITRSFSGGLSSIGQHGNPVNTSVGTARQSPHSHDSLESTYLHEMSDDFDVIDIPEEDAQSLIEYSISRAATRLKSPQTPTIEKAAAMEELDGEIFFDSDPETPPATMGAASSSETSPALGTLPQVNGSSRLAEASEPPASSQRGPLSLGKLPSPKPEARDPEIPITPWHAGPKPLVMNRADAPSSSLHDVFDTSRTRSLSGGAEALRKFLPKGFSSMAQVGNLFGSSNSTQKSRPGEPSSPISNTRPGRSATSPVSGSPSRSFPPQGRTFQSVVTTRPSPVRPGTGAGIERPKIIRRVTSDDSLLYHSLSRASSLGDDTRFENHREQVNSRVKAIRDSLQDRSSFRMPQMPSMPSMPRVPSFSFNMNFLNSGNVPARWRADADAISDILPEALTKKKPDNAPSPAITYGTSNTSIFRPKAAAATARSLVEGTNSNYLDRAMDHLTGDVVIMGGYRGSILRSTKTNRQVWVPVKVGLNIRKVDLEVGLKPEDEERMPETIYASGMLQNIGPVDISKRLFKRLNDCENARTGKLRVWDYGYDWRLSPHLLSRNLTEFLANLPSNQSGGTGALVIAHSLGGLITRHVVNRRPELFSGVVYAGVPQACVNILGPIRNGDDVLLSSRVLTAQVNFTLRTSFVLLPEDGECFIDINTREKYPVDFFNLDDWIKYRWTPCLDPPLPPRNQQPGGLKNLLHVSSSGLSLPIPGKRSVSGSSSPQASDISSNSQKNDIGEASSSPPTKTTLAADVLRGAGGGNDRTLAPQMGSNSNPVSKGQNTTQSVSTAVTIPRPKAIEYLRRTLAETKKFRQELHFIPELSTSNRYPPLAVIYGKSIPTLAGAKVDGREGIACSDSYDNLAFASGDGVCLARQAMLPEGYKAVYGGRISSDRGHVTLLGDLNAVGRAIEAVLKGRSKGIGLGVLH
jgi:hypothetical protein